MVRSPTAAKRETTADTVAFASPVVGWRRAERKQLKWSVEKSESVQSDVSRGV
jgi:hypothetical protein